MILSIVVAVDEHHVIGKDNRLIWHLPADLRHFKNITMGHYVIMGRKTFDSIGKALPGRTFIVITRQKDFTAADCIVVHSLEEALKQIPAEEKEAMIIGGAQIFEQVLPVTERIHLTRIHHSFEGDTFFPPLGDEWQTTWEEHHEPDEKNQYPYTFLTLEKKA